MNTLLDWIDQRTGLCTALGDWLQRPVAGGPAWRLVWPSTIAFTFVTQAVTGLVLWMYYSPGAQSAWESVYYLQYQVQGGWLLRAIHHYSAQVMLVLAGLYLVQMILRRGYRAPGSSLFWTVLLMGLVTLGLEPHRRPAALGPEQLCGPPRCGRASSCCCRGSATGCTSWPPAGRTSAA